MIFTGFTDEARNTPAVIRSCTPKRTAWPKTGSVGNAVVRNRAKRLIREAARLNAERIKTGYDMVIIARGRCAGQDFSKVQRDLLFVLRKLELLKDEKNTDTDD